MAPATGPLAQMRKARQLHEARAAEAAADRAAEKPPQIERAQVEVVKRVEGSSLDQMVGDDDEPLNAPSATPPPPTATQSPTTATPPPPTSAGGVDAPGFFNLLSIESIGATFDGAVLRAGSFQALGELRLLQLAQHGSAHAGVGAARAGPGAGAGARPPSWDDIEED